MDRKVILSVEYGKDKKLQVRINTTNEALLALSLLKAQDKCTEFMNRVSIDLEEKIIHNEIMSIEFDDKDNIVVGIHVKNKGLVALALRKAYQCVDFYLEEEEIKKVDNSIKAVPASVLDRLGM